MAHARPRSDLPVLCCRALSSRGCDALARSLSFLMFTLPGVCVPHDSGSLLRTGTCACFVRGRVPGAQDVEEAQSVPVGCRREATVTHEG